MLLTPPEQAASDNSAAHAQGPAIPAIPLFKAPSLICAAVGRRRGSTFCLSFDLIAEGKACQSKFRAAGSTLRRKGIAIMLIAAASITYHAGANKDPPDRCVNQVRIVGANPPKIVKAPL